MDLELYQDGSAVHKRSGVPHYLLMEHAVLCGTEC